MFLNAVYEAAGRPTARMGNAFWAAVLTLFALMLCWIHSSVAGNHCCQTLASLLLICMDLMMQAFDWFLQAMLMPMLMVIVIMSLLRLWLMLWMLAMMVMMCGDVWWCTAMYDV